MLYDAFICHASEDKADFVRPLAEALAAHHLNIWYDEFSLNVGDSLRQAIDDGLAKSRFGIVVLSGAFFKKGWAQRELNGLVAREIAEERRLILPIWHDITQQAILQISPPLADVFAINSSRGLPHVCEELLKKLRPEESPLIAARDELIRYGHQPPVISDEWWLDIVELKETDFSWPYVSSRRWIFPLPYSGYVTGKERGLNIAWTAMQLEWSDDAEERKICQITHPDSVHEFVKSHPGLTEMCYEHPLRLAEYVPQLMIRDFSGPFTPLFDELLIESIAAKAGDAAKGDGNRGAMRNERVPLCGDGVALRHPTFGNHVPGHIADKWMTGSGGSFSARCFDSIDYLVWLLSDNSAWLPIAHREFLIDGMRDWSAWASTDLAYGKHENLFIKALFEARRKKKPFRFTASMKKSLESLIEKSLVSLNLVANVKQLADNFIDRGFVPGFFEFYKSN